MSEPALTGTWVVTGLTGTLAPKVATVITARGGEVAAWDRNAVPVDDGTAGARFLDGVDPAGILHLGMGPEDWAGRLAAHAASRSLPFVFTSTVSVFGGRPQDPDGPFHPSDEPTATDDYGSYKARCERAVLAANPHAVVARLGWQADPDGLGNNMVAQLDAQAAEQAGVVRASALWRPATSWMTDTATALVNLTGGHRSGIVHLDSNAADAWSFPQVVRHVAGVAGRDWQIVETQDHRQDQRLVGDEDLIARLSQAGR